MSNLPKSIFCHQIHPIPLPLCKPIRKRRATLLSEIADIGYNATKKEHYYGVKLSIFITELGFSVNYVVSAASVHDIQMVKTLAQTTPSPQIIWDKGYLSKDLKTELAQIGITITTPIRKNMTGADKVDDCLLGKRRKAIETVFSSLETLGIQAFKSRSLQDFGFRLIMRIWTRHPL
ncbi:IS982 family transposase [Enterococcus cecorum]|nr:IS982 family transposase [Enterococcus cecorum]